MKKICLAALFLLFGYRVFAEKTNDPLPDYVGQFNEADALIRGIDSTTPCTKYYRWMDQAIWAKKELKLSTDLGPWFDELSDTCTNSWKNLHAVAYGLFFLADGRETRHASALQLMDRAFRSASLDQADPEETARFFDDFITMLLNQEGDKYLLQLDSIGSTPSELSRQKTELQLRDAEETVAMPIFYDLPDSYETASNDGERIRWLLQAKPTVAYSKTMYSNDWTMPAFAVLVAGSHINLPAAIEWSEEWLAPGKWSEASVSKALEKLTDDETIVWGYRSNDYRIVELPEDYRFIADYELRGHQGDRDAAETLGNIFVNRCRLERAAQWYERAGCTNKVREIRANQGVFLPHGAHIYCKPISIDYFFRNGSEVECEIYSINAGSNLLSRLITKQVPQSEMELLRGDPADFQELHAVDYADLLGERLHNWTLPLSPLSDHKDAAQSIRIPQLDPGNYLLRAAMKDGNQTETILHIYDTVLYRAEYYDPAVSPYSYQTPTDHSYILCDALTGKPRPWEELHFCTFSGGIHMGGDIRKDGPHTLEKYIRQITGSDGCFVNGVISSDWTAIALTSHDAASHPPPQDPLFTGDHPSPFVAHSGAAKLEIYSRSSDDPNDDDTILFTTTDRPIYRPGDTGHLKIWCVTEYMNYRPTVEIYSANKNYPLPLETNNPTDEDGDAIYDEFGCAEYTFTIPEDAPLGSYRFKIGRHYYDYEADFQIEEYRAPEFRLDARLNDESNINISAGYTYGKPLASGTVTGRLDFKDSHIHWFYPPAPLDGVWGKGYWWNGGQYSRKTSNHADYPPHCSTAFTNDLNASGQVWIDLTTVSNAMNVLERPGYFEVNVTATDPAGKQFHDWLIVPTPSAKGSKLCCWLDKAFYSISEPITCHAAMVDQSGTMHFEVFDISGTNTIPIQNVPCTQQQSAMLAPLPAGTYSIRLASNSGNASQPFEFAVIDDSYAFGAIDLDHKSTGLTPENPIRLVVEKGTYQSNETARLLIQVDRPGRYVYWFPRAIDGLGFSRPEQFQMNTVSKTVELPMELREDKGIIQSAAFTIVDGEPHIVSCTITIQSGEIDAGTVTLIPDQQTYKPGEEVSLAIRTLDSSGSGRSCSVTVTVYNKMLDLWAAPNPPRIVDALSSLWRNCSQQTLDVYHSYKSRIHPLHPKWVMESFLPSGDVPIFPTFGFPKIFNMTLFGCASIMTEDDPLADDREEMQVLRIREDFRDLAYWNATIITDSNGCANVSFPMPDGLMEWKIKDWAMHTNYAAEAETSIRCAKDFVAQLNTPRFMIEGDELECSTSVRNHTTNNISCVAAFTLTGEGLQREAPAEQKLNELEAGAATMAYWNTRATAAGTAEITTTVTGGSESDGMKIVFPILLHGLIKRGGHGGVLAGDKTNETVNIIVPAAIDPESLHFQLHTTPNMLEALTGALPFLADYPYGCTEQTLNRFLPSLIVMQTMNELGIERLSATSNMPPERQAILDPDEIRKRAQAGIDRLEKARARWSGWGWNMDSRAPHDTLITGWVLRGLHRAAQIPGLDVPHSSISPPKNKMLDAMDDTLKYANDPTNKITLFNADAFKALVLSEIGLENPSGEDDPAMLNEDERNTLTAFTELLFNHADQLSLYGKILLANAYDHQGNTDKRDQLVAFVEQYLEHNSSTGEYELRTGSREYWYWYNDDIELHAWYLKQLNRMDPHGEKAAGIARHLMQNRIYGDHSKSTRDTAICIEALAEFAKNNHADSAEEAVSITLNGQRIDDPATAQLLPGSNQLLLTSADGKPIFFDATWQYYSKKDPITAETCDLVSITRSYSRAVNGTNIVINPGETIQTGETLEVELTIKASQTLEYLMAEDRKPAGFEAIDTSSGYSQGAYRELHDERVSFYLNRIPKGTTSLRYRMRAEHAGKVSALPATIELMYEPRQAANTTEDKLHTLRHQTSL